MFFVDLRRLILLLATASSLLTMGYTLYGAYSAERTLLIEQALEKNRAYALKLASSTDAFIANLQQQLRYSASVLSTALPQAELTLGDEVRRLQEQNNSFNSVLILNDEGRVLANAPQQLSLIGTTLKGEGTQLALHTKEPVISPPYLSATGRLLIFISHPIFDGDGNYKGLVGGSIYLHEPNSLNALLGEHFYRDGSYIYVVDQHKRLIFHRDVARIGEVVHGNPAIDAVSQGQSDAIALRNVKGVDMLTGFAPSSDVKWGVVVQSPTKVVLDELTVLLGKVLRNSIPFFVAVQILIWMLAMLIAKPLRQLARQAPHLDSANASSRISQVHAWYFESRQIKLAMLLGLKRVNRKMGVMNVERNTDPLTGLNNRRGMAAVLQQWKETDTPFSVLTVDIDHFKRINDTHGHDIGDLVLSFLADTMRACTRETDLICRVGGEEFCIFLPDQDIDQALQLAERLRILISETNSPAGSPITISIGLAHWPVHAREHSTVLKLADAALYKAKRNGRNRVELCDPIISDEDVKTA
ncbi:cell signaling regulator [Alcaligenes pakistanensis]|uniref:diguanylate cyclase n=1 Tax=Alcaligenes pakistanensis TaxID=1482717 RepID=A0A8H9IQW6_9BURK|nr:sensor domain-containing diguanylate cyclase [Alcaligenes pakistanensis]GHC51033.1 cell signaling regulator [Alcaligenes pakistanensis]HCA17960.1 diguanylate cyclase [Alcaligenes faecalis]